jgi:hypothetical protein
MQIRVIVHVPNPEASPGGAAVRVYIEDTARIDAAAVPVAESITRVDQLAARIPVEIACREPTPQESFNVRVHIDMDGSGQISPGDSISTTTHSAKAGEMNIAVKRVD